MSKKEQKLQLQLERLHEKEAARLDKLRSKTEIKEEKQYKKISKKLESGKRDKKEKNHLPKERRKRIPVKQMVVKDVFLPDQYMDRRISAKKAPDKDLSDTAVIFMEDRIGSYSPPVVRVPIAGSAENDMDKPVINSSFDSIFSNVDLYAGRSARLYEDTAYTKDPAEESIIKPVSDSPNTAPADLPSFTASLALLFSETGLEIDGGRGDSSGRELESIIFDGKPLDAEDTVQTAYNERPVKGDTPVFFPRLHPESLLKDKRGAEASMPQKRRAVRVFSSFSRSFGVTAILFLCPLLLLYGTSTAYEAVRANGFADFSPAVSFVNDDIGTKLQLFDYVIDFTLPQPVYEAANYLLRLIPMDFRLIIDLFAKLPEIIYSLIHSIASFFP